MKSKWKPPGEISWTEKRESAPDDIGKAVLANPTRKQLEKAYSKRNALIERNHFRDSFMLLHFEDARKITMF